MSEQNSELGVRLNGHRPSVKTAPEGLAEAKRAIAQEKQERTEAAGQAITAILQEYGVSMVAEPVITEDGRISARVMILANE